jgi:phage shock protein E
VPHEVYSVEEMASLLEAGAQLLDVLDPEDYEHSRLPGAVNIPLKQLTAESAARLDRGRPVVVYCNDFG